MRPDLGAIEATRPARRSDAELLERNRLAILVSNNRTTMRYPVIVARELGLFDKDDLEIEYLDPDTTPDFAALLVDGSADAVMLDAAEVLQAASRGIPLTAIYETMQRAPDVLSVLAGGPVKSLEDLRGQTIGLASERDLVTVRVVLSTVGLGLEDISTTVVGDRGAGGQRSTARTSDRGLCGKRQRYDGPCLLRPRDARPHARRAEKQSGQYLLRAERAGRGASAPHGKIPSRLGYGGAGGKARSSRRYRHVPGGGSRGMELMRPPAWR